MTRPTLFPSLATCSLLTHTFPGGRLFPVSHHHWLLISQRLLFPGCHTTSINFALSFPPVMPVSVWTLWPPGPFCSSFPNRFDMHVTFLGSGSHLGWPSRPGYENLVSCTCLALEQAAGVKGHGTRTLRCLSPQHTHTHCFHSAPLSLAAYGPVTFYLQKRPQQLLDYGAPDPGVSFSARLKTTKYTCMSPSSPKPKLGQQSEKEMHSESCMGCGGAENR